MLRHSLEVLARGDPELVERLCWPVDGSHIVEERGETIYRLHQGRYRLSQGAEVAAAAVAATPLDATHIFVFGLGLGEQVDALLAARPQLTVTAWERDPWLVRLALERNDWADALGSGRLRLLLGSDLVAFAAAGSPARMVAHPFLGSVYQNERLLLAPGAAGYQIVALCAGALYTDDLAAALRDEGFGVYTLDIHRLSLEESARAIAALRPAFIAAVNYTEGLAEFAAAQHCKLAVWEIDPATSALPVCRAPTDDTHVFTYRKANVADYRAAGFTNVTYLPLATDPRRRARVTLSAEERQRYGAPVAFVGSSLMPQVEGFRQAFVAAFAQAQAANAPGARAGLADNVASVMNDVLAQQRQDWSRYVVPAALAARVPHLERSAPQVVAALARPLGEIAAAEKRTAYLSRLARAGLGVDVWGDEGWAAAAAAGVHHRGSAGHAIELTKIYNASAINLDIGRLYQDDIVTMRVFDVLACGGFVLAEYSDALAELFQLGVEIDCYRDDDELEAKVRHYLDHPELALKVAARGQHAVLTRHTVKLRLREILGALGLDGS